MENVSAACAMEWSIQLERAFRSKSPGRAVEAISEIGSRLEQWSREPEPTMAVYNVFGLVAGEDKLFANTILLRLADAFRLGDKPVRLAIVRVFKSMFKLSRKRKRSEWRLGFLSNARVHNPLELLKRVKEVYDNGDVESRAMALVLFGCWADFACECAQIRYLIFTSLVSSHDLEVRASLFAAACFCEVADDFAAVILEMQIDMAASPQLSLTNRLAAVQVLSKMGCSHSIANKAYKKGLKLISDSCGKNFLVAVLVSLTKLASKSTTLASQQTDYIFSFVGEEKSSHIQAVALRCLHFLIKRGMCYSLARTDVILKLSSLLAKTEFSLDIQIEALQILQKILLYKLGSVDDSEFARLVIIVEKASHSPVVSSSFAAIKIMVDLSIKVFQSTSKRFVEVSVSSLLSRVITLILGRIILLGKPSSYLSQIQSGVDTEVQNLFNLLLMLVGEHLDLAIFVLNKISIFIENIVNRGDNSMEIVQEPALAHEIVNKEKENGLVIRSKFLYYMHKIFVRCLENLDDAGAISYQLYEKVKHVVESASSSLFDCYTQIIYSLLLHSPIIWYCLVKEKKETCGVNENSGILFVNSSDDHEVFSLECAKKLLMQRDYWSAYRAGTLAARLGAWVTAAFIFSELRTKVQSDSCLRWLESLNYFARAERRTHLRLSQNGNPRLVHWLRSNGYLPELAQDIVGNNKEPDFSLILHDAQSHLSFSMERLESNISSFCFQRWFLALKVKVLESLVDLIKGKGLFDHEKSMLVSCNSLQRFTQVSVQLQKLAWEFDLLASSFIDIDQSSLRIIGSLALSCSVLASTAAFATIDFSSCSSQNGLHLPMIQDLVGRLRHIDPEISKKLSRLVNFNKNPKTRFNIQPKNQILSPVSESNELLALCRDAVSGMACLWNRVAGEDKDEIVSELANDGLGLLMEIVNRWIHIPFRTPKYFFQTRPTMGSELVACSMDSKNPDKISVLQGFQLQLDLCLKLKNMSSHLPSRIKKLYCLLYCRPLFQIPGENEQRHELFVPWKDDEMIEMREILFQHVIDDYGENNGSGGRLCSNVKGVYSFVCFQPNERGQGFSTCLLDVSRLPVGSYPIKWLSCCINDEGSYVNLLPLSPGPVFTICKSFIDRSFQGKEA